MRLTLVVASLSAGGTERVVSVLADSWRERGIDVAVITLGSIDEDFFSLDPRIDRIALGDLRRSPSVPAAIANNVRRILRLRAALQRLFPAIIVSFGDTTNVKTLLAAAGLRIPVLISERSDFRTHRIGRTWSALRRLTYSRASGLVVPSEGLRQAAAEMLGAKRVRAIPNPARLPTTVRPRKRGHRARRLLAVGRLGPEKQFDQLLRAFAASARQHPDWTLTILGDGPLRGELARLVSEMRIGDRVAFPGVVRDTEAAFCDADLFALTSRYEGFPNALVEAMACGVPVVCFDCSPSIREIVRPEVDGVVVPPGDAGALAVTLDRLMGDEEMRLQMGSEAKDVTRRFSLERVMGMWTSTLREVSDSFPEDVP